MGSMLRLSGVLTRQKMLLSQMIGILGQEKRDRGICRQIARLDVSMTTKCLLIAECVAQDGRFRARGFHLT